MGPPLLRRRRRRQQLLEQINVVAQVARPEEQIAHLLASAQAHLPGRDRLVQPRRDGVGEGGQVVRVESLTVRDVTARFQSVQALPGFAEPPVEPG